VDERERDRLYGVPLAEFVRARNELAARLRKAGKADAAAEIARLRKPSAPLWAINQLARTDPGAIARLIETTEALRSAQLGRQRGGDPGARAAAQRSALEDLVDRAASLLHPGGSPGGSPSGSEVPADTRGRLSASFLGAAADRHLREDLRRGRLDRELSAPGFEVFAGARPVPAPAPAPAARPRRDARQRRAAEARAEAAVRAARKHARALEAKADRLTRAAAAAERAAASRKEAAERARQAASQAGAGLREAEERLAAARRPRVE
jgi:hypothetical protein